MPEVGEPLSPQAADLVRRIARTILDEPDDLLDQVHAAVAAAADEPLRSDPTLVAEMAASTRSNVLHLAAGIERDPGGRVPANLSPAVLGIAREAFRRGIEQAVYTTYHAGQNAVQAYWMRTAFALSADPAVLRQALEAGSASVAGFIDNMVAALSEQLRRERADLARSSHARRFEVVSLILDSAPITPGRASTQLSYDLRRRHTAAVLWTDPRHPDQAALAAAAEALGPVTGARQVLTVIASSSSVWAWLAAAADTGAAAITAATAAHPGVRVAVGPAGVGADGFRRSHFDAVATQRLMSRRPDLRVARFADVQLVALALADEQRAREFVARTLGELADADPELRDTLCVYIGEQFSAARAARALYTHRNTVLNRLQRAERLLPLPLAARGLEIGVALEIAQWLGTQPGSATHAG
ncbi:MAG TPA: helix-turn-helix domain-containing protein [Streptosporangiaceae bacterium]|nr:helix-turn-helix domain-containing protein [Streptosporangiaceae bacterium]